MSKLTEQSKLSHRLDLRPSKLNRTIFALAAPAILENLMFSMVFFADTLIVAWLQDERYLAGVALASLTMFWSNAPIQALSIATVSIVSRTWGEKDYDGARRYAGHALVLTFAIVLGILIAGLIGAEWIIRLFGAEAEVIPLGAKYLRIVLFSSILGLPLMITNAVIRAKGDTRRPMYITVGMNIINIVVSVVLAFGLGPFPRMELFGVAYGTVLARNIGGLASLIMLISKRWGVDLRFSDMIQLTRLRFGRIWHVAYPAMADRIINCTSYAIFMTMVAKLGTTVLAAHQIALNVESLAFMPAFGMSVAVTTIFGQAVGSGRQRIGIVTVKRTILFSGLFMVALGILFAVFAPIGVKSFRATADVIYHAGLALRVASLELPLFAISFIFIGALRGAGDTRSPLYVTILCTLLLRLPGTYLFAFIFDWGIVGVWLATGLDWAGRSLGLWWVFHRGTWKAAHQREKRRFEGK